jgi:hypothetical protein
MEDAYAHVTTLDPSLVTRVDIIQSAMRTVPLNPLGLPEWLYRADMISPYSVLKGAILSQEAALQLKAINRARQRASLDGSGGTNSRGSNTRPPHLHDGSLYGADDPSPSWGSLPLNLGNSTLILDQGALHAAQLVLNWDEGFPTLPDGRPMWHRMDFEPMDAYYAFEAYLHLGKSGARQASMVALEEASAHRILGARTVNGNTDGTAPSAGMQERLGRPPLAHEPEGGRGGSGPTTSGPDYQGLPGRDESIRELASLADSPKKLLADVQEWRVMYFWAARAKAYDLFFLISRQRNRNLAAFELESDHLALARRLRNKVLLHMGMVEPEDGKMPDEALDEDGQNRFWKNITPQGLIALLGETIKLERISSGLSPQGSNSPFFPAGGGGNGRGQGQAPASAGRNLLTALDPGHGTDDNSGGKVLEHAGARGNGNSNGNGKKGEDSDGANGVDGLSTDERARRVSALLATARARRAGSAAGGS